MQINIIIFVTEWSTVLLRKVIDRWLLNKSPAFVYPQSSLSSRQPATTIIFNVLGPKIQYQY